MTSPDTDAAGSGPPEPAAAPEAPSAPPAGGGESAGVARGAPAEMPPPSAAPGEETVRDPVAAPAPAEAPPAPPPPGEVAASAAPAVEVGARASDTVGDETARMTPEVASAVARATVRAARASSDERRAAARAGAVATAPEPAPLEAPPLERGQCALCGTKNRPDDILCAGCGTNLSTGEPPPVERFRPRRFDARILMALGLVAALGLAGIGIAGALKVGADERLLAKGADLARGGEWRAAERELEEAVKEGPENARAWALLAEARLRNGATRDALGQAAERALKLAQPGIDVSAARFALGKVRLDEGRFDEASKALEPAVKERSDLPSARHILGHCRYFRRESNDAILAYEQALAADPGSPEAPLSRLRLGILYVERGKLAEAEKALDAALASGAPAAEAHAAKGDLRAKQGNIPAALECYVEATRIEDRRAWTRFKMARLRLRSGDKAGALADVARAVEIDAQEPEFWKLDGQLRDELGEPDRALLSYAEAAKRNQKDADVRVRMSRIEAARGNAAKARDELLAALRIDGDYLPALLEMGDQAAARKDWRAAIDAYRKAAAADPSKADTHVRLARALEQAGQAAEALNAHRDAVSADPSCVPALERLLEIYTTSGRADDAKKTLLELARVKPEDTSYKLRLAAIRIDAKEYPLAERLLEEVLKREPGNKEAKTLLDKVQFQKFMEQPQ